MFHFKLLDTVNIKHESLICIHVTKEFMLPLTLSLTCMIHKTLYSGLNLRQILTERTAFRLLFADIRKAICQNCNIDCPCKVIRGHREYRHFWKSSAAKYKLHQQNLKRIYISYIYKQHLNIGCLHVVT